jgi:uncharacterized protein (TIGR03437 family)
LTVEAPQKVTLSQPDPLEEVGAPGGFISLAGTGLGPVQEVGAIFSPDGSLSTTLAGTTVKFDGIPAPLLSVQAEKIVCIVPFEVSDRNITVVQVETNGSRANSIRMVVPWVTPGILAILNADGTPNSSDRPAEARSMITVFVTGLGQTVPPGVDGTIQTTASGIPAHPINLFVAPVSVPAADVLYIGPAPGMVAGVTQINFRVPQLPSGQYKMGVGSGVVDVGDFDFATLAVK